MSALSQPASRSYQISDAWLEAHANDPSAYVDLDEIKDPNRSSAYIAWLVANTGTTPTGATTPVPAGITQADELRKANFTTYTGIAHYSGDNDGTGIYGCLKKDSHASRRDLSGHIVHPLSYRRVYAWRTTAREIEFVGF